MFLLYKWPEEDNEKSCHSSCRGWDGGRVVLSQTEYTIEQAVRQKSEWAPPTRRGECINSQGERAERRPGFNLETGSGWWFFNGLCQQRPYEKGGATMLAASAPEQPQRKPMLTNIRRTVFWKPPHLYKWHSDSPVYTSMTAFSVHVWRAGEHACVSHSLPSNVKRINTTIIL